jgi:alkylhydroperoxidase family enzyme
LLHIAHQVQVNGKNVTDGDVEAARKQNATDNEIHDTVLIAAAFCMYNRYVDGLGTWAPGPKEAYEEIGKRLASDGYMSVL